MGRTVRVNCDIVSEVDVFVGSRLVNCDIVSEVDVFVGCEWICELSGVYSEGEL